MRQPVKIVAAAVMLATLGACVAGSQESQHAAASGVVSQLVLGFWHGLIAPATLIVEIVNRLAPHTLPWDLRLYEARDTGAAYDLGFYLGMVGGPTLTWGGLRRRRV